MHKSITYTYAYVQFATIICILYSIGTCTCRCHQLKYLAFEVLVDSGIGTALPMYGFSYQHSLWLFFGLQVKWEQEQDKQGKNNQQKMFDEGYHVNTPVEFTAQYFFAILKSRH